MRAITATLTPLAAAALLFDPAQPVATPAGLKRDDPAVAAKVCESLTGAVKTVRTAGFAHDATLGSVQRPLITSEAIPLHGGDEFEGVLNNLGNQFAPGGSRGPERCHPIGTGQGGPGQAGGPPGDLFLEVHFKPQARFRVQGSDGTASLALAPWEAALGAQIEVPTPTSRVQVTVPAGWKNGHKLRLKGHGIPARAAADPAGEMYLELELVLPPADTPKARELCETMARDLPFNPRPGL